MAVSAGTTPRETRLISNLGSIATDVARVQPDAPVLFVIGHVVSLAASLALADEASATLADRALYG
jgi:uroporphyrin-III C-methyltransferase